MGNLTRAEPAETTEWVGSSAIELEVGSPDIAINDDGSTTTSLTYRGKKHDLEAARPERGSEVAGYTGKVSSTRLSTGRGGRDTLTVTIKKPTEPNVPPEGGSEPTTLTTFWEVDWRTIEKPLTACILLDQESDTYQIAVDAIEAWRNAPAQRRRNYQIPLISLTRVANPNVDADWEAVPSDALKICQKIAAGVEVWLEFNPVIIKTSLYDVRPETGGCGKIGAPAISVAGYDYLKTGDNLTLQTDNTWRRTETWQGGAKWDTDLYGSA